MLFLETGIVRSLSTRAQILISIRHYFNSSMFKKVASLIIRSFKVISILLENTLDKTKEKQRKRLTIKEYIVISYCIVYYGKKKVFLQNTKTMHSSLPLLSHMLRSSCNKNLVLVLCLLVSFLSLPIFGNNKQ